MIINSRLKGKMKRDEKESILYSTIYAGTVFHAKYHALLALFMAQRFL